MRRLSTDDLANSPGVKTLANLDLDSLIGNNKYVCKF